MLCACRTQKFRTASDEYGKSLGLRLATLTLLLSVQTCPIVHSLVSGSSLFKVEERIFNVLLSIKKLWGSSGLKLTALRIISLKPRLSVPDFVSQQLQDKIRNEKPGFEASASSLQCYRSQAFPPQPGNEAEVSHLCIKILIQHFHNVASLCILQRECQAFSPRNLTKKVALKLYYWDL